MANQTELLNVSDEMKLEDDRQNLCEELIAGGLCSSSLDTTEELSSSLATDTLRGLCEAGEEKLNIIGNEYDIPIEENLRKDVSVMCNLSQGIKEDVKIIVAGKETALV